MEDDNIQLFSNETIISNESRRGTNEPSTVPEIEADSSKRKRVFLSPKKPNKKIQKREDPRLTHAYNILENVSNTPRDECTTFGEHVISKLRKFNERRRSILMHKINNLIFDAEMELYSQQEYVQHRPVYSNYASSTPSPSSVTPPAISPTTEQLHDSSQFNTLQDYVNTYTTL